MVPMYAWHVCEMGANEGDTPTWGNVLNLWRGVDVAGEPVWEAVAYADAVYRSFMMASTSARRRSRLPAGFTGSVVRW